MDFVSLLDGVDRGDDEELRILFAGVLAKHLDGFRLDDAEIEKLLEECWGFV